MVVNGYVDPVRDGSAQRDHKGRVDSVSDEALSDDSLWNIPVNRVNCYNLYKDIARHRERCFIPRDPLFES